MKTIHTTATVQADGTMVLKAPPDVPPGEHRVILMIEETTHNGSPSLDNFPIDDPGPWPEDLSLRREDLYRTKVGA
ncbi:MAG: hypothetical protein KatS3mg050_0119 [Litorilinea sp.]|nr:MAG: hypothetical protein KatS3mg050_0119 [Litorilinea sp.]